MTTYNVSGLGGALLDMAAAMANGDDQFPGWRPALPYSTVWAMGGPIIERERMTLYPSAMPGEWCADLSGIGKPRICSEGPAPLIAAMRAFVASKFGETIDLDV